MSDLHFKMILSLICVICVHLRPIAAADPTYWQDVRPILRKHCTVCHAERRLDEPEVSAGLALDKPELVRKGGKVPVLVPGKPDESLLIQLLTTKDLKRRMPLDADPLPAADVATIRKWVAAGAPEGTRPAEAELPGLTPGARQARVRKLDVTFPTRAALPKTATPAGPLAVTLPVGPLPPVAAVAFSPDGQLLATGVYGRVTVWDLAAAKPAKVLTNVLGAVNDLKFSPDGRLLAVAGGQPSARGDLRLFDTADWKLAASLGGHLDTVSCVSFSPDGTKLASASFDKTVRLWDVKAGTVLHTFTGHSDFVYAVAFSPKGEWYATVSKDRTGRVVDAATGKGLFTLSGMNDEVLAVAVRPDGAQVVTSGFETQLNWWDPKTAERVRRSGGPGVAVHEIAIDPKGTLAAVAGGDGTVRLYRPTAGDQLRAVPVGSPVFAVAIDPAGKRVASGAADGTVKVWDAADARQLVTLWSGPDDAWLALTLEGYFAASDAAAASASWRAGGKPVTEPRWLAPLNNPEQVGKAAAGQKVPDPPLGK
jgi:DNA-binding beta-propeller fold protein YncE